MSRLWSCTCGLPLVVVGDGKPVQLRYRGRRVTTCPSCRTGRLNLRYREQRRAG